MKKNYTIGLDIGTNSVGWSVLTEDYQLVRRRRKITGDGQVKTVKKNFWGVRLFDEGQTAEGRRIKRTTRRRISRRRNRLKWLQAEFWPEIKAVDENFFQRLGDSFLVPEDKKYSRHPIFATLEEEVRYHEDYPTIYHLRKELADANDKADIRLVYLALAHIIKYRGNFLIEGKLNTENSSVEGTGKTFLEAFNKAFRFQEDGSGINLIDQDAPMQGSLMGNYSRTRRAENTLKLFPQEKTNGTLHQFIKLIVGNQGNFKKVFELGEDAKLDFSKEEYEENLEELLAVVGDDYSEVFMAARNLYEALELSGILATGEEKTQAKLSAGMIERYQQHKTDLTRLKAFVRENLPKKYDEIFKDQKKNGYAGYIEGATTQGEFYSYLKKILEQVEGADYFMEKIQQENFLRKQRTFDNGVIPHQIHLAELQAIMANQALYYPFLKNQKAKIESLLTFRIPYYVGPLTEKQSDFAWLTKKNETAVRPWNLAETIDLNQSATDFIERMTNFDSYLPLEKVLPKHSLLYQKFTIFNELTKVSFKDEQGKEQNLTGAEKKKIFQDLFKEQRKVSQKRLEAFLLNEYGMEINELNGIEKNFNASYGTYHDLLKLGFSPTFLDDPENEDLLEEIVKTLTIFEDRKMIREQLSSYADVLTPEILKKLERRHYQGWGRLSKKIINGLRDQESHKTILDFLIQDDGYGKNPNRNFMQLINDDQLSFKAQIEKEQRGMETGSLLETVQHLAGSPAIKKGILQSLKVVEELVEVMGYPPKNIVVEMARENQTTGQGTNNAKPRMKSLEIAIKEFGSDILKEYPTENKALQRDRLYLYYLQNGKDIYTEKELDIHNLSNYDIDHIIPQSFTTDNSIDNRVLTSSRENRGKSNTAPSSDVANARLRFWQQLKDSGLMSRRKFDNLTKNLRGGLTDEDRAGFIKRQLVETRQITKNVARILDERFNQKKDPQGNVLREVKVITLKSALTSQFRKTFGLYKVREINDYHHGHDAYLNGVVALALLKKYPKLEPEFVYGEYPKFKSFKENKATAKKEFYTNIMRFLTDEKSSITEDGEIIWDQKHLATVKKTLAFKQMNIVKKVETQKGGFSKESILPKKDGSKLIPRKNNWETAKYGGFDSPIVAYSAVVEHAKGKKKKITQEFVKVTIMERGAFENDPEAFLIAKGFIEPRLIATLPKYALFEFEDGRRRLLASASEAQKGNQMVLPENLVTLLHHAQHFDNLKGESRAYIEEHRADFAEVLKQVEKFAERYTLADKNLEKILALYEENKTAEIEVIAQSFVNLLQFNAMGAPADFKFFDVTIGRKRYTSINELLKATVVYQSVTGLHETRRKLGD